MVVNAPVHMRKSLDNSLKIYLSMVLKNMWEEKPFVKNKFLVSIRGKINDDSFLPIAKLYYNLDEFTFIPFLCLK